MSATCCRFIIGQVRNISSPFARLLATDYYDGPTAGLVQCGTCRTSYAFAKLDWDDQQDMRVFSLSPIRDLNLELIATPFQDVSPRWPQWVIAPSVSKDFWVEVDRVLDSASSTEFVVATADLLSEISVWRPGGLDHPQDWFKELALDRTGSSIDDP
jgi:hypothetical protein